MASLLNPTIELIENNLEVKSYVYQQIMEFEPFITPETIVAVIARDPRKLALQYETEGKDFDPKEMSKLFRIAITLKEEDTRLEAEALHEDIFEAIRLAKEALLKKLITIQESIVSPGDRLMEINHFLQNPVLH